MNGRRSVGRVGGALVASLFFSVMGALPAWAAPALVAAPNTNLVDGQTIAVTGSGFAANTSVVLTECGPGGEVTPSDCDLGILEFPRTDDTGSFSTSLRVRRIINTSTDGILDCATPGRCAVGVDDFAGGTSTAAIRFDPNVPPLPGLEIAVRYDSAAVQDNQVLLRGTVTCNQPASVTLEGRIRQTVRRFFIDGHFSTQVDCDDETPFSVLVEGENGVLKRGEAKLDITASGFTSNESDAFTLSTTIQISSK